MVKGSFLHVTLAGSITFIAPKGKHCTTAAISIMITGRLLPILFSEELIKLT